MSNDNKLIIAGFAGIGKTYLGKKYSNVKDMESSIYKYDYSKIKNPDYEKLKGDRTRIPNKNFPQNYINGIKQAQKDYDIITIWFHDDMFKLYNENNINFCVCYPTKAAFKKYYIQRYKARGNSQIWIDGAVNYYNRIIPIIRKTKIKRIILHNSETLEDWLKAHNYELKIKIANLQEI